MLFAVHIRLLIKREIIEIHLKLRVSVGSTAEKMHYVEDKDITILLRQYPLICRGSETVSNI